ncbi:MULTISPECIES: type II toxin-antitoxin system death-on-curing family toxin [Rhizobium/Agrobacterium group]|uniref:type II toxin-antitoxin system death-on-curing family toxin n=1 Tax=Rhizobium/Agrobacterium group TaxID=227290 RepID=UPI0008DC1A20|nr:MULTISPECIES: type II toxin-antitoxin system death-on-curing family toxin [Rhizobium/Agrobacterium group]NSX98885.1 type II toxin-antitoxin system death-on-curing family toxin [Agrobacterium vitis]NSZ30024.1 type II toxin-antitoxin system death-on-curing family toxin [Agrobacterium vitis]NSZ45475.1 type II toxin-antitoxin system death-on-curing family toxin [Agrobacterium vitis]NSZ55260.1 type II toxin-antitoxin system death-on-curing family toxin [Agrobacterium vitis]NTA29256.1 type II tox
MPSLLSEPLWLPYEVVVSYNLNAVTETGENHALLFHGKLEGALLRPYNSWRYESNNDVVSLGVLYMEAIAQAHAFEQGNKRTGFDAGFVFMYTNGWELTEDADQELVAVAFLEIIERTRTTASFEDYLKNYIQPL